MRCALLERLPGSVGEGTVLWPLLYVEASTAARTPGSGADLRALWLIALDVAASPKCDDVQIGPNVRATLRDRSPVACRTGLSALPCR